MFFTKCVSIAAFAALITAQAVPNLEADECENPYAPTTFPNCNFWSSKLAVCSTAVSGSAQRSCYCQPQVLSAIFGCDNEVRLCQGAPDYDTSIYAGVAAWSTECSNYTSFPFTTPLQSQLATTLPAGICSSAAQACQTLKLLNSQCMSLTANATALASCACRPALMAADYSCEYKYAAYCGGGTTANISTLFAWKACPGYQSILIPTTLPPMVPASATGLPFPSIGSTLGSISTFTDSIPPSTASSTMTVSSPTATAKSAADGHILVSPIWLGIALGLTLLIQDFHH